jgi:hypothetical protein
MLGVLAALAVALTGCDVEVLCADGQTLCGERCVSTAVDAENCGGCGVRCGSHEECDAGTCGCAVGAIPCGDACVDTVTDPAHCGGCDVPCAAGEFCRSDGLGSGCQPDACPGGLHPCGHACVALATDRFHCGQCGVECRRGESCRDGACVPDLYVACFATDDVRPVSAALRGGIPQPAGDGPVFLAVEGPRVHVSSSLSHSVTTYGAALRDPGVERLLGAGDLENVTEHEGHLYVSNSDAGTLVVMRGETGAFVDEVVLSSRAGSNPRTTAFRGETAYVALAGKDAESGGQEVAIVDFSGPRGVVTGHVSVAALASAEALAFPSGVVVVGERVYVTIANLGLGPFGYTEPAGPSKLAVIDTASGDAVTEIDLGAGCTNAGAMAEHDGTLWVVCSGTTSVLPVHLSGGTVSLGTPVSTAPQLWGPWNIDFCRGMGYVTDSWSGTVMAFDPTGAQEPDWSVVCPKGSGGWAYAADVACAP